MTYSNNKHMKKSNLHSFLRFSLAGFFLTLIASDALAQNSAAGSISHYKLDNGMQVYIWQDNNQADIHGRVSVHVGSKNDPEQFTGLAHYLEHLMFKGTDQIGTTDWEQEKILYEQIIAKYDEKAASNDPATKEALNKEINELSIKASEFSQSNEFSSLVAGMGGTGMNAGTSYDLTTYYNDFPPNQLERFLMLYAERFRAPVFRTFQSELETVYEEYNLYEDQLEQREFHYLLNNLFKGHPYERPIIGLSEHLKNPQISKLIEFYNNWYVPENMALILVGNIDPQAARPLIEKSFGSLPSKTAPSLPEFSGWKVEGRKDFKANLAYIPRIHVGFKGAGIKNPDALVIDLFMNLLTNRSRTGYLDKLVLDGDLMGASASHINFEDQGRIVISAIPSYDPGQQVFASTKAVEKLIFQEIERIKQGNMDAKLVENIKKAMIRSYQLNLESNSEKAEVLTRAFISGKALDEVLDYTGRLNRIQITDIQRVASDYCNNNYMLFDIGTGKSPVTEKLEKPDIKPITQSSEKKSAYALAFEELGYEKQSLPVNDFKEVIIKPINTRSKLFYTQNTENDVFSLILKYGIGTEKMPYLEYSTALMNNAGIMGGYDPQEFKKAITELNVTCRYSVDEDYLYVVMEGFEEHLVEALGLLTRQILMPQLDEKQYRNVQGSIYQNRLRESKDPQIIAEALAEYMAYGDKSGYLDRKSLYNIFTEMGLSKLTGEFQRATDYEAEVHFCGKMPFDEAYDILSQYLPLKANEKESSSPEWKAYKEYSENTIYFLPRSDTKQAKIYFFAPGNVYKPENDLQYKAFNRYFGDGGLTSLVIEEIREKNSMAYTAYGFLATPPLAEKQVCFEGYVGTQSDKVNDAVALYMKLVDDMPLYEEREKNLKAYLELEPFTTQPGFRSKSQQYEEWKRRGYTANPALQQEAEIQQFNLQQMLKFYQQELKGKPMAIAIVGDPKLIDLKALGAYGKVVKITSAKLFSKD